MQTGTDVDISNVQYHTTPSNIALVNLNICTMPPQNKNGRILASSLTNMLHTTALFDFLSYHCYIIPSDANITHDDARIN